MAGIRPVRAGAARDAAGPLLKEKSMHAPIRYVEKGVALAANGLWSVLQPGRPNSFRSENP